MIGIDERKNKGLILILEIISPAAGRCGPGLFVACSGPGYGGDLLAGSGLVRRGRLQIPICQPTVFHRNYPFHLQFFFSLDYIVEIEGIGGDETIFDGIG
jgi:hypothetical protein